MKPAGLTRRAALAGLLAASALPIPARAGSASRVASLDDAITETLIALGRPPVAAADTPGWARWVIEPRLPADVVNLGAEQEVNLELLASLRPDLILFTSYLDGDAAALERVAPTRRIDVSAPGSGAPLDRAAAATKEIASLVGVPEQGEVLAAMAEVRFSHDAARLQDRRTRPIVILTLLDGRHLRAYGSTSLWGNVIDRIGLRNGWTKSTNAWGFGLAGIEALADVPDAVLVAVDPVPPDALSTLDRSPLWHALPSVRAGRVLRLPVIAAFGALPAATRFSRLLADALDGASFD